MKLIESKAEYIPQEEGLEGIYKMIEVAGRTAYHSQDKITPTSAKDFVDRMIKSKHGVALEHGTVYLKIPVGYKQVYEGDNYAGGTRVNFIEKCPYYNSNPYSKSYLIHLNPDMTYPNIPYGYNFKGGIKYQIVTTNYRVLVENNWLDDLQYLSYPTEFHDKRYTMRFTCSRAIANELVRHRTMSFLQESTRYINYSKERHGGEITFIKPSWLNVPTGIVYWHDGICWRVQQDENNPMEWFSVMPQERFSEKEAQVASTYFDALSYAEEKYFFLLRENCQPQQARDVLPNATKTELIMTGFSSDWKHVMDLRLFGKTGAPHPDMKDLMQKAQAAMQEAGIWNNIMNKPSKFE